VKTKCYKSKHWPIKLENWDWNYPIDFDDERKPCSGVNWYPNKNYWMSNTSVDDKK